MNVLGARFDDFVTWNVGVPVKAGSCSLEEWCGQAGITAAAVGRVLGCSSLFLLDFFFFFNGINTSDQLTLKFEGYQVFSMLQDF